VRTITDRHGELIPVEQINVLPQAFTSEVLFALLLAIICFALVFLIEYWASRTSQTETTVESQTADVEADAI
jgi:hypothetical protein